MTNSKATIFFRVFIFYLLCFSTGIIPYQEGKVNTIFEKIFGLHKAARALSHGKVLPCERRKEKEERKEDKNNT